MTPETIRGNNLGNTSLTENLSKTQGIGIEAFVTFVFVFVIHSVCDERRSDTKVMAPFTIGITATVCHFFAVSIKFLQYQSDISDRHLYPIVLI